MIMNNLNGLYEKNLQCYQQMYSNSGQKIVDEKYILDSDLKVYTEKSCVGEDIVVVEQNSIKKYLAGKYAPERALIDRINDRSKIKLGTCIVIIGMANIHGIKELIRTLDDNILYIIYEPSISIFLHVMKTYDITDILSEYPVSLIVDGINSEHVKDAFSTMISWNNATLLQILISGNYDSLFSAKINTFITELKKHINSLETNMNTLIRYTNVIGPNVLNNIGYLYNGYNVADFEDVVPDNIPTIIVSAGPSLDGNIDELKKAVGKAIIVATDTAVQKLLAHGITPDFAAVVDGKKPAAIMDYAGTENVPLITYTIVSANFMNRHHGKKIFCYSDNNYEDGAFAEINKHMDEKPIALGGIPTGGSVACNAFMFGYLIGSKTFIFVGQDLAYKGAQTYASGTFWTRDDVEYPDLDLIEVEGNVEKKVYTQHDFNMYRIWFEDTIRNMKKADEQIRVINATEGGAKIAGTEVMTLKEAIQSHCVTEYQINNIWKDIQPMLSNENKKILLGYMHNSKQRIDVVKKKAKQGIVLYNKMLKMCQKKVLNTKQYSEITRKIKKVNNFLDTDHMARFVMDNLQGIEYTFQATSFLTENNEHDERILIAKEGICILNSIYSAATELETLFENTVELYNGDDKVLYDRYDSTIATKIV